MNAAAEMPDPGGMRCEECNGDFVVDADVSYEPENGPGLSHWLCVPCRVEIADIGVRRFEYRYRLRQR